jgi:hypothetical protein
MSASALEELYGAFVAFGRRKRAKGPEIPALPGRRIPLARIEAILARF